MPSDEVLDALDELIDFAVPSLPSRQDRRPGAGHPRVPRRGRYSDIVVEEVRPLVVEMIGDHMFGVTRQRISQLLGGD